MIMVLLAIWHEKRHSRSTTLVVHDELMQRK